MPKVIIWRDGAIESEFDPGHRDWRIGRSETNDVTLLDPRKSVSRFHAELREENGRWVFIDLNSQNGSWRDGQRVNRLVLEHGHEVLFGDYKLSFEDQPTEAAPFAAAAGVQTADIEPTMDVPIAPDQTLLMPGAKSGATPAVPAGPPPPVMRQAARPKVPRKGINPAILVLFLVAMLGVVAALAWRMLAADEAAPQVAEQVEEPPVANPPPVVTEPEPPATQPAETAGTGEPAATTADGTTTAGGTVPAATGPSTPVTGPALPPGVPAERPGSTKAGTARARRAPAAPKESPALAARYEEGRRALSAGRFADAQRAFEAVVAEQANFRDAAARLTEARQGQAAAREKALADAQALEAKGDWARAVAAYERAGASDQAGAARDKMTAAGDDAYRKARQFDARSRPGDAIGWYQRAVEWLPDSDARKATARERLAALKGGE